ncbi:GNAT family N-acetyltransferase [Burkholderia pyrrocinia]
MMQLRAPHYTAETGMFPANVLAACALRSLDSVPLNTGFVHAVLEGQVDGGLWVDRPDAPRVWHARHPYGMSLVWGDAVDEGFEQVVNHIKGGKYRTDRDEWLQVDPRWQSLGWDRHLGVLEASKTIDSPTCVRHSRVNFTFDEGKFVRLGPGRELPDGWRLRPAIAADWELPGQVVPRHFWRNAREFLAAGGGWCAEHAGHVGAIAFVSYRWGDEFEIGIETFAHARRQGLGLAVATRLISDVLKASLIPVWSCRMENAASYSLAQVLGFLPRAVFPYYQLKQYSIEPRRA